ncbi:MAG: hypothetical protein Q7T22_08820 [Serpentinimonas sp.]|nr:hypothetical protein [Serpentinimonas sp.]
MTATSVSPSTAATRTRSPTASRASQRMRQRSPRTSAHAPSASVAKIVAEAPISSSVPLTVGRARAQREAADHEDQRRARQGERHDRHRRDAKTRHLGVEQHQAAEDEGDDPAQPEHAEPGHEYLGDHQRRAQQQQPEADPVHRQHVQSVQAEQQADRAGHARHAEARAGELDEQPVDADHHQHDGHHRG